jgi:hypothetical protein
MIKFNTKRLYTAHGQRIAAEEVAGGVVMVDIDRNLDYFLPGCLLTQTHIMDAYDWNRTGSIYQAVPDGETRRALILKLWEFAAS